MFVSNYENGEWQRQRIVPFQNLSLSPAAMALHYGQSIFEGMKAFRMIDGSINIFRIDKHHERINRSLSRMCMPSIPEELFTEALIELVSIDRDWVPSTEDSSLYIRPFVFASEARFGMNISKEYQFVIFTGPVSPVYTQSLKVKVEREYIRAAKGGTGYAKCCGNYGGALYPTQLAKEKGYDQVLWTDATHHEYFEESGITNIMFVVHNTLITPRLTDSILDGITRDCILQLARQEGIPVEESRISVQDIQSAFKYGTITEAFCVGTGAVVAPISVIGIDEHDYELPASTEDSIMYRLKRKLDNIRYGKCEDTFEWNNIIE
jgi:branched-chain amino acid aminotransferase